MKPTLTFVFALLISAMGFAQQGINYKAVIKDNSGNVVANQSVDIQFTILKGTAQTSVYQETQTPTTDANGIAIVNIGKGTTADDFSAIDWASDDHFLNVQIDTGSGFTDMGTTQFMAVPYALQALKAGNTVFSTVANVTSNVPGNIDDDDFVFGSDQLDFNNADVNVLDSRMFFDKSKGGAFRVGGTGISSGEDGTAWNVDNIGGSSFASGQNTEASATASTAMGSRTTASGLGSTAMGSITTASGGVSIAMGYRAVASGDISFAMGDSPIASAYNSIAMGRYNIGGGNKTTWVDTDPLFEIGNGSSLSNRSNALTVLKNGKVGIGTQTPADRLTVIASGQSDKAIYGKATGQSGEAIYGEATGLYGKGIHVKVTSTHSSANAILAVSGGGASYAGYFVGTVHVSGDIKYTGTITDVSDRRLKENLKPITNVLGQLQNIKGYTYNMKDDATKTREYGVIAQDVQKVFPDMVKVIDDKEHLGVSYIQLIPVLLEAIKEQQKIIDSQNKENVLQKAELSALTTNYKSLLSRIETLETNISH